MRLSGLFLIGFLIFLVVIIGVSAEDNDSMTILANIFTSGIQIEVPDDIFFGNLTKGYTSERVDVYINNTGTVDITVNPELSGNYTGTIFNYTMFKKVLGDDPLYVGDFSVNISKPDALGEIESERVYMWLNLTDYPDDIDEELLDHTTEIVFWAVEND